MKRLSMVALCLIGSCLASCMATIDGPRLRFDSIPKGMAMASVGLHPTAVELEVNVVEIGKMAMALLTGAPLGSEALAEPDGGDE